MRGDDHSPVNTRTAPEVEGFASGFEEVFTGPHRSDFAGRTESGRDFRGPCPPVVVSDRTVIDHELRVMTSLLHEEGFCDSGSALRDFGVSPDGEDEGTLGRSRIGEQQNITEEVGVGLIDRIQRVGGDDLGVVRGLFIGQIDDGEPGFFVHLGESREVEQLLRGFLFAFSDNDGGVEGNLDANDLVQERNEAIIVEGRLFEAFEFFIPEDDEELFLLFFGFFVSGGIVIVPGGLAHGQFTRTRGRRSLGYIGGEEGRGNQQR